MGEVLISLFSVGHMQRNIWRIAREIIQLGFGKSKPGQAIFRGRKNLGKEGYRFVERRKRIKCFEKVWETNRKNPKRPIQGMEIHRSIQTKKFER